MAHIYRWFTELKNGDFPVRYVKYPEGNIVGTHFFLAVIINNMIWICPKLGFANKDNLNWTIHRWNCEFFYILKRNHSGSVTTMWGPQTIAKLVNITPISLCFMDVYGPYNELVTGLINQQTSLGGPTLYTRNGSVKFSR